jgi:methylation protein EvaC
VNWSRCLICDGTIERFISFGRMPIANGFLGTEEFAREYFFELGVAFCERCAMPQLTESVPREKMFHEQYPFFTSSSARMAAHFEDFASGVMRDHLAERDPFVVEIGSNDGTLLRHFAASSVRHLGVEPSSNVAAAAAEMGVHSTCRFFDEAVARDIAQDFGPADAVLAANCFCHVHDLHSLAKGVGHLLKPRGVLIFEDPYLGDILAKTAYDQIYDEHAYYFCVTGVSRWLAPYGLEIVDVEPHDVHGGSMRYTVARRGAWPVRPAVPAQLQVEIEAGLHRQETYEGFRRRVEKSREDLIELLQRLRGEGRRVAGYGATSKSTTVLNYCGIGPDLVEFISDTTPLKQGKFSPGMHIPVRSEAQFRSHYPGLALLFAWNHAAEILEKEREFARGGGKWISYVPKVEVLDPLRVPETHGSA